MKKKEQLDQEVNQQSEEQIIEDTPQNETEVNLEAEIEESKFEAEIAELKDKYLRLYSDFENFRKRSAKERIDLIKTASEDVLRDLIPVVDDFERASKASESETDPIKIREGNQLIFIKLVKILESKGLKVMDELTGKPFDPDTQEAITQVPAPSEELKGMVIDVIEKGYTLGDKVVRYAKVVTGA
ncbi:nucleotide exchange factor GrpE [Algoriphagus boritolerans]|uniref:Protein GrpE n=1 Tax=Algoriphagus boritolerans DSM 17298 = JCM 18970 TaxID=1120964 RepID=A0A1H5SWY0_9BACT|nr:nucleotide exchange factor GrpE [Algoriphagus boritolerans]SEF55132.1 molecular chaperone GrpE [Algoriphagus boritolerans DSM 17298 = JCM 18970]